jgi:tight adherence protein B
VTGLVVAVVFGFGVVLVFDGLTSPRSRDGDRAPWPIRRALRSLAPPLIGGAAALAGTGWPVAAVTGAVVGWELPRWVRSRGDHRRRARRRDAIAEAAARIRDSVRAGVGLGDALSALGAHGPAPIRSACRQLAVDLQLSGMEAALDGLRARLDDPLGDLLCRAVFTADRTGGRNLSTVLEDLAETARRQAATLREIRAHQARNRYTAAIVAAAPVALLLGMRLVNPEYLAPYRTAAGQVVLAVVFALIAAGYLAMARVARLPREPRSGRAR